MPAASTELELVRQARRGDGAAFAELIRPHYRAAFRVAFGLLHDKHEAEDAVQDAALKAWTKLGNLRDDAPLRSWFLAIVANRCRRIGGSRWWSTLRAERIEREASAADVAAGLDLRLALSRLRHDDRLILVLRFYVDMPYDEIADTLHITTKAARTRVERALKRIRPVLEVKEVVT